MTTTSKDLLALRCGRAKVVELFGADLRSLAALRIVLAVLVLSDLAGRVTDLSAHYTDKGVLPRSVLLEDEVLNRWSFSLSLMNGELFFQALLFIVAALAALALLVGYRTRLMTIIVWVLVLSIQWRNPLVLNDGDTLLRVLLFWGVFLPLGACWSVDRALKTVPPRLSMRFLSIATVGLFLQIAFMYWFTAMQKSDPEWRMDGTAIYYALSVDQFTTPVGTYLLNFPTLLTVLTFGTILLETFGPFLLFFPIFNGLARVVAVLAFMGLHFGIWLTMDLGIFSLLSAFCMVCFLPGWFWGNTGAKLRAAFPKQPDVMCRLRHAVARPAHTYWSLLRAQLYITVGVGRPSVAMMTHGDDQSGSHATHTILPPAASTAGTTQRQGETQPNADETTAERGTQHSAAAGPGPTALRSSFETNLLAAFILLYVFCWNLTTVSEFKIPERAESLGSFLGLKQSWDMFAPSPTRSDGWYVVPGTLRDGQQVDLMPAAVSNDFRLDERVSWEKPQSVADTYENKYWRKYLGAIREDERDDERLHFGRYICRGWNARHAGAEQLTTFQITYVKETTLPAYQRATPQKEVLWEHRCS